MPLFVAVIWFEENSLSIATEERSFSLVHFKLHDVPNTALEELPINCSAHYFLKCLFSTWGLFADWNCRSAAVVYTEAPMPLSKTAL